MPVKEKELQRLVYRMMQNYGTHVVQNRSLADFRDGMLPVQRRIVWAAFKSGMTYNKPRSKAARLVGETLGKFHPHSDCLRGDTLVPLLNGKMVTIRELSDRQAGSLWVLAFNEKTKRLEPAKARAWRVGHVTNVMSRIHLSTGEILECTENSPFHTKKGWLLAENLSPGSLLTGGCIVEGEYRQIAFNGGSLQPLHVMVAGNKPGQGVLHHKNENRQDNRPTNLECLSRGEHAAHHGDYAKGLEKGRDAMFGQSGVAVDKVERVVLPEVEDFYDFTVDTHHNMIIVPKGSADKEVKTFCVVHNSACFGSIVGLVNQIQALIDGEGNWGSLTDSRYASMRYVECRLSKFASKVLFDPFYLPLIPLVPNYDDKDVEPLFIPSLLPLIVLNGTFGIAVGISGANIPCFTLESVVKTLKLAIKEGKVSISNCIRNLQMTSKYEGTPPETAKEDILHLFKHGSGRVQFESSYSIDRVRRKVIFTKFAPFANLSNSEGKGRSIMEKVMQLSSVERVIDESNVGEFPGKIAVYLKRSVPVSELEDGSDTIAGIVKMFSAVEDFRTNVTERNLLDGKVEVSFRQTTIPQLLNDWLIWRKDFEVQACNYQINVLLKEIRVLDVMMLAVKNRELIIQALGKELTDEQLEEHIAKSLNISIPEAKMILDLKVRQLRKLESKALQIRKDEKNRTLGSIKQRKANPGTFIAQQLTELSQ